jgi:hypothetical protein
MKFSRAKSRPTQSRSSHGVLWSWKRITPRRAEPAGQFMNMFFAQDVMAMLAGQGLGGSPRYVLSTQIVIVCEETKLLNSARSWQLHRGRLTRVAADHILLCMAYTLYSIARCE